MKQKAAISIQSCIRGYLQRCQLKQTSRMKSKLTLSYENAVTIIQKCYRGFLVRKAYYFYRQRLRTQILCFLQQIELISNDFFTKTVKTNYSVSLKSIESHSINLSQNNKYMQKFSSYLFTLPPPPPPLPSPSPFTILSPPLPPPDAPTSIKPSAITSAISLPSPPPSLCVVSRPSPQSHHQLITSNCSNRSSSPSIPPVSKFAQVRDIFARAEAAAAAAASNSHHYHYRHSHSHHIPIKIRIQNQQSSSTSSSSHQNLSIEQTRSPKPVTVLSAVQEYQRQHINNHYAVYRRFGHLGVAGGIHNRPNNYVRSRGVGSFISNNNKSLLQNKPTPSTVLTGCVPSSPKQQYQQSKLITSVN